jgi:hypothetical protein
MSRDHVLATHECRERVGDNGLASLVQMGIVGPRISHVIDGSITSTS